MISDTAIQEFKKVYAEEFGEEISDECATELGITLLALFHHIYRPVKQNWFEAVSGSEKPSKN